MSLFMMQNFHALTLFIWIVSILTLSISDEVKTDGSARLISTSNASFIHTVQENEHQTLPVQVQSTPASIGSTKILNKNVNPLVAGEGGPIAIVSTTQHTTTTASQLINSSNNLDMQNNLLKEEENILNAERRKNTSKIVSRKGANEMLDKQENVSSTKIIPSNDTKPIVESSTIAHVVQNSDKHVNTKVNNSKSNIMDKHINNSSDTIVNSNLHLTNTLQEKLLNATVTASSVQEHRPKPTATVVGPNSDKRAFISHTKGSHLGMSKKIDYVLPVIVTLIALPVLGAIIFMVYKQGRDCWDKRHYRRMDFLIDGMYND